MQNSVCLTGRLSKDVELKTFDNGDRAANFSLAVQRNYKNKQGEYDCDFINCSAKNTTADILLKYFKKGDFCPVSGELHTRKYEKDGVVKTITYVEVNNVTFVSSRASEGKKSSGSQTGNILAAPNTFSDFSSESEAEYDLPF